MVSGGRLNLANAVGSPPNGPPTVTIATPTDGSTFDSDATILFEGTASDPEEGDLTASLVWTSSIDGHIDTEGSFSAILTDGVHTITASATDSGAEIGSDSISITVGSIPALIVDVTTDEDSYAHGETVVITVKVTEDGAGVVAGAAVHVVITTPKGKQYAKDGTTNASGEAMFSHNVHLKRDGAGTHTVDADAAKAGYEPASDSTTFVVE